MYVKTLLPYFENEVTHDKIKTVCFGLICVCFGIITFCFGVVALCCCTEIISEGSKTITCANLHREPHGC